MLQNVDIELVLAVLDAMWKTNNVLRKYAIRDNNTDEADSYSDQMHTLLAATYLLTDAEYLKKMAAIYHLEK